MSESTIEYKTYTPDITNMTFTQLARHLHKAQMELTARMELTERRTEQELRDLRIENHRLSVKLSEVSGVASGRQAIIRMLVEAVEGDGDLDGAMFVARRKLGAM